MKASEFKKIISSIVAEEVKKQLPVMLSEMFVRRIVAEQAGQQLSVPQKQIRTQTGGARSLAEAIGFGDDEHQQPQRIVKPPVQQMNREQLRAKIRNAVLEDPTVNPMAELYEGTQPIAGEDEIGSTFGAEGVPLEMLGFDESSMPDFGRLVEGNTATGGPIPETEAMAERRLARKRAELDAMKVG